jgi:predicted benzoate:H+ symporter BenE
MALVAVVKGNTSVVAILIPSVKVQEANFHPFLWWLTALIITERLVFLKLCMVVKNGPMSSFNIIVLLI